MSLRLPLLLLALLCLTWACTQPEVPDPKTTEEGPPAKTDKAKQKDPPENGKPKIDLEPSPDEKGIEAVQRFLAAYASAVLTARGAAMITKHPIEIIIDKEKRHIRCEGKDGKVIKKPWPYPELIELIKAPSFVRVKPNKHFDFDGKNYDHPFPHRDTAHILGRAKGSERHAWIRFTKRTKNYRAMMTKYGSLDELPDRR